MEEHVESIKSQVRVLNAGGLILHSFWHGQGEEFYDGLRFHYYDEPTIEALYEPYFEILTICNY